MSNEFIWSLVAIVVTSIIFGLCVHFWIEYAERRAAALREQHENDQASFDAWVAAFARKQRAEHAVKQYTPGRATPPVRTKAD